MNLKRQRGKRKRLFHQKGVIDFIQHRFPKVRSIQQINIQ